MKYKDLFIDFDDTLYDTHGNSVIALQETYEAFGLARYFANPQVFYDAYWQTNIDLWTQYSKGESTRDYLIVERFRRPLSVGEGLNVTEAYCLEMSDRFLEFCSSKSGVVDGAQCDTTLMIGDNLQTDILGAMAAGLDTLFFNRYPEYEKTTAPTFIVTSLRDIMNIL